MKVNILSTHRFHLLDLARELSNQGYDVLFYSYIPAKRCAQFGMDGKRCVSFLWLVWPFFLIDKLTRAKYQQTIVYYRNLLIDYYVSLTMRQCDYCIGLGTVYFKSFQRAKQCGATTILEWGSKHILEEIKCCGTEDNYPPKTLRRELSQYEICDRISIPSSHVMASFLARGMEANKLMINPYGVDIDKFYPMACKREFDLIFVGAWRYRKGVDLLAELCKRDGYSLLHVGSIVDIPFPNIPGMVHHDAVDQNQLVQYYAKAKIFILPSRTEGLAMVQAQALACGLPIVCSIETGGRDLRALVPDDDMIFEMEEYTVESLSISVKKALAVAARLNHTEGASRDKYANLTWRAYGIRYASSLSSAR